MNRPRNPIHFPHMKLRGARRKLLAPYQRMARGFDLLSATAAITAVNMQSLINQWHMSWGSAIQAAREIERGIDE